MSELDKKITFKQQALNAIEWLDYLTITELKQARHDLGDKENGFCCIGVGCYMHDVDTSVFDAYDKFNMLMGAENDDCLVTYNDSDMLSFKKISKKVIDCPGKIFTPQVAKKIRKHYS